MTGTLHVLERANPAARRLHSQRIEYEDMPERGRRFVCRATGCLFKTDSVVSCAEASGAVFFHTRHTAYLLERDAHEEAPCPPSA
jgi:hypothetical protein